MTKKENLNNSIIPTGSTYLVKVGSSIEITNKIIRESSKSFFKKGMTQFENKNYESAILHFSLAIANDSKFIDAIFYRGFAKSELGFYDESIYDFKRALELDNKHIASLYQISYSYCSLKHYNEALATISIVIEIDPDWHSYMQRTGINKELGRIEESNYDENKAWK